jgi:hypothetical protein
MTANPLAPFPWKGVTLVQPLTRLPVNTLQPPWGGPAEAA